MDQPSLEDWIKVGNDIRKVMNDLGSPFGFELIQAPKDEEMRIPTEEDLALYDAVFPGFGETLKLMAAEEMNHRHRMESLKKNSTLP